MKNCPNCGAPIETAKCPYCGTLFLDFGAIDIQGTGQPLFLRFNDGCGHTILRKVVLVHTSIHMDSDDMHFFADDEIYYTVRNPCERIEMEFETVPSNNVVVASVEDWRTAIHPEAQKDIYDTIKGLIQE